MSTPKVYVACLAAYNNGILHGKWVDVDADLHDNIQSVLNSSPIEGAEEWAFHDHEGFDVFAGQVGEYSSVDELIQFAEVLEWIAEDDSHSVAVQAVMDYYGEHYFKTAEAIKEAAEDVIVFEGDAEAYAEHLADEGGLLKDVPQELQRYIDFKAWAHDMELNGEFTTASYGGTDYVITGIN